MTTAHQVNGCEIQLWDEDDATPVCKIGAVLPTS
jgi:hypothetical protein